LRSIVVRGEQPQRVRVRIAEGNLLGRRVNAELFQRVCRRCVAGGRKRIDEDQPCLPLRDGPAQVVERAQRRTGRNDAHGMVKVAIAASLGFVVDAQPAARVDAQPAARVDAQPAARVDAQPPADEVLATGLAGMRHLARRGEDSRRKRRDIDQPAVEPVQNVAVGANGQFEP
jgi:hypothetical protein